MNRVCLLTGDSIRTLSKQIVASGMTFCDRPSTPTQHVDRPSYTLSPAPAQAGPECNVALPEDARQRREISALAALASTLQAEVVAVGGNPPPAQCTSAHRDSICPGLFSLDHLWMTKILSSGLESLNCSCNRISPITLERNLWYSHIPIATFFRYDRQPVYLGSTTLFASFTFILVQLHVKHRRARPA